MSYDIDIREDPCVTCGHCAWSDHWDPTYNLGPLFEVAIPGGVHGLSGKRASETLEALRAGVATLHDPARQEELRKIQSPNGWGTLDDARMVLRWLMVAAEEHPNAAWSVT